jgi:excisionase family DNA binding protein
VDEGDRRGVDRLTIQEAARRLGVSEGAVRKRVTRGTLEHHKDEDGRVYVYLDAGVDGGVDEGVDPNSNVLISQLRDEVAYLRDENRRKDEIIMQQAMTMRQLTAAAPREASEPRESPETVEKEPERAEPRPVTVESQESVQRPWWRRVFGR